MCNKDKIKAGVAAGEPADELRIALMKVCRNCWNESSNAVRFIKQITDAEKLALNGIVKAIPEILAKNIDANLVHEASIGKIAGEQLIKLMSLGLNEKEAEEVIIKGFLK